MIWNPKRKYHAVSNERYPNPRVTLCGVKVKAGMAWDIVNAFVILFLILSYLMFD